MTRARKIVKTGFVRTRKMEVSLEDVHPETGAFELLKNRRQIMDRTVASITNNLAKGINFDSPFVVNIKTPNSKMRITDANHRFKSLVNYLTANPNDKVEITLFIYEGLSEDEEKKLYTKWNKGRKQSCNDFVKQFEYDLDIFPLLKKASFPATINVYGGTAGISFYKLVSAYLAAKQEKFVGGYSGKPEEFIEDAQALGQSDVTTMAAFLRDFQQAFGSHIKNNRWLRTTPFQSIFRIWMDNHSNISVERMVSLLRIRLLGDGRADDLGSASGMGACKYAHREYVRLLNNGRARDLFAIKEPPEHGTVA